jgi:exosortase
MRGPANIATTTIAIIPIARKLLAAKTVRNELNPPDLVPSQTSRPAIHSDNPRWLGSLSQRVLFFVGWIVATCLLFMRQLVEFVNYSLSNDNASHLVLIPFISAWILYLERDRIFKLLASDGRAAALFLAAGTALALLALFAGPHWNALNQLSLYVLGLILLWVAGFAFFFGRPALQSAKFPVLFVLLTIPIPDFLLDKVIYLLQRGSAEIAAVLFDWSGVPVLREGFVFHLARVNIEVARECSGIRSSLALLILAILVAHFYLDTFWKQTILVIAGLFVMILKNGVRIVTLTLLASYVDPSFLYGRLHREGGVVFFLIGLLLLAPLVWLLQRTERNAPSAVDG